MILAFDANQKKDLAEVWLWYEFQDEVLVREKFRIRDQMFRMTLDPASRFDGMTVDEVREFFDGQRKELDFVAMLDLMAAAEAAIRLDFSSKLPESMTYIPQGPVEAVIARVDRKALMKVGHLAVGIQFQRPPQGDSPCCG